MILEKTSLFSQHYSLNNEFVVRKPLFPVNHFFKLFAGSEIKDEDLVKELENPVFWEAIYLGSPSLIKEILKWKDGKIENKKKRSKIKNSIIKYLIRSATRTTPFGLFSGIGIGNIGNQTDLNSESKLKRKTYINADYIFNIGHNLLGDNKIRQNLNFSFNSSCYFIGSEIRCIEQTFRKAKRDYKLVSIEAPPFFQEYFKQNTHGLHYYEHLSNLTKEGLDLVEAQTLLNQLIDFQLFVPCNIPSISGPDTLIQLIDLIASVDPNNSALRSLVLIKETLDEIDENFLGNWDKYQLITSEMSKMLSEIDENKVFNTVLVFDSEKTVISAQLKSEILDCLEVVNKISKRTSNQNIEDFKRGLYNKFETEKLNLNVALDSNIGIGFGKTQNDLGIHPFLEGITLNRKDKSSDLAFESSPVQSMLMQKIHTAKSKKLRFVDLHPNEFKEDDADWITFTDSGSVILSIVDAGGVYVRLKYVGGYNSLYLLGRFCLVDDQLQEFGRKLAKIDELYHAGKILAEVVHTTEDFYSSVLVRPVFRDFEIPYMSSSILDEPHQINTNEISISIDSIGNISLFSEKHQKEIIPRVSNAHSFTFNTTPVYSFLAQMQQYEKRTNLDLNSDLIFATFKHVPRIQIGRIILQDEIWIIADKDVSYLCGLKLKKTFHEDFKEFLRIREIPPFVLLVENESELAFNLSNLDCIDIFLDSIKGKKSITLFDFFPFNDMNISEMDQVRINEVVLFFNKTI